jgi:tetratricopeptide (TPR) repeat protein
MTSKERKGNSGPKRNLIFIAYYATIGLFFIATLLPQARLWGLNWWGHFPAVVTYCFLAAGLIVPLIINHWMKKNSDWRRFSGGRNRSASNYIVRVVVTIIIFTLSFTIFQTTTHFLGDGYQLLSRLADGSATLKFWDFGAAYVQKTVFTLLGGEPDQRALLSYRLISILAGILFLVGTFLISARLFEHNFQRYFFAFGVAAGGYMLMFFGYVENYALLICCIALFCMIGLLVLKGKASIWWLVILYLAAQFLHIFGIILLPGLLYLLLWDTGAGKKLSELPAKYKILVALVGVIFCGIVYHYLHSSYYFFTFALMPIIPDRFTVDNDWLFSFKHFLDIINLLVMLVPGLFVFLTTFFTLPVTDPVRRKEYRFLAIILLSGLGAVWVFNPGIGMPRNWDLFSIAGIPLAVSCFYFLFENARQTNIRFSSLLAISLGLFLLIPRVATQVIPDLAVAHFRDYLSLDKVRSRNARRLLIDYYRKTGDVAMAKREQDKAWDDYPESALNKQAKDLMGQGNYIEAMARLRMALDINPIFNDGYANLGGCYLATGEIDSAISLLTIADGLNPYSATTMNNIGTAYLRKEEYPRAIKYFHKSLNVDSTGTNALAGLASVHMSLGEYDQSLSFVTKIFRLGQVSYDYFRQAGDALLEQNAFSQARKAYAYALERGLDPAYVRNQESKYPNLRQ